MDLSFDSVRVHVVEPERIGSEKEPPLFFIHGAGCDASIWDSQAGYFRGRHLVYRVDLPGHGKSSSAGEEEIAAYTKWVRLVLEEVFPSGPFVLIGHSMGGAVALDLAASSMRGLHALVIVGTGAKLGVTPIIFRMLKENPEDFFQTIDRVAFAANTSQVIRDRFVQLTRKCPPSVIFNDFKACDRFDVRDRLSDILRPTLIVCGEEDLLTPLKSSLYLHENIRSSAFVAVPKAGHILMDEQPALLNRAIEDFLAQRA